MKAILGEEPTDDKQEISLNRMITFHETYTEIQPDPRHAGLIIAESGLLGKGVKDKKVESGDDGQLDDVEKKTYPSIAIRLNYLADDRPELRFTAKELARLVLKPARGDARNVKRAAR